MKKKKKKRSCVIVSLKMATTSLLVPAPLPVLPGADRSGYEYYRRGHRNHHSLHSEGSPKHRPRRQHQLNYRQQSEGQTAQQQASISTRSSSSPATGGASASCFARKRSRQSFDAEMIADEEREKSDKARCVRRRHKSDQWESSHSNDGADYFSVSVESTSKGPQAVLSLSLAKRRRSRSVQSSVPPAATSDVSSAPVFSQQNNREEGSATGRVNVISSNDKPGLTAAQSLAEFLRANGKMVSDYSCPICLEVFSQEQNVLPITLDCCLHSLCLGCCNAMVETSPNSNCPMCRSRIRANLRRKAGHLINEKMLQESAVVYAMVKLRDEEELRLRELEERLRPKVVNTAPDGKQAQSYVREKGASPASHEPEIDSSSASRRSARLSLKMIAKATSVAQIVPVAAEPVSTSPGRTTRSSSRRASSAKPERQVEGQDEIRLPQMASERMRAASGLSPPGSPSQPSQQISGVSRRLRSRKEKPRLIQSESSRTNGPITRSKSIGSRTRAQTTRGQMTGKSTSLRILDQSARRTGSVAPIRAASIHQRLRSATSQRSRHRPLLAKIPGELLRSAKSVSFVDIGEGCRLRTRTLKPAAAVL
ncbi:hypothetical protein DFJ73DRAFT_845180 [Zopfochytrium polystomum]|nr:hypothetical protein DFJ73DRAFT_845180 [Zopfochytrium polystomum]